MGLPVLENAGVEVWEPGDKPCSVTDSLWALGWAAETFWTSAVTSVNWGNNCYTGLSRRLCRGGLGWHRCSCSLGCLCSLEANATAHEGSSLPRHTQLPLRVLLKTSFLPDSGHRIGYHFLRKIKWITAQWFHPGSRWTLSLAPLPGFPAHHHRPSSFLLRPPSHASITEGILNPCPVQALREVFPTPPPMPKPCEAAPAPWSQ